LSTSLPDYEVCRCAKYQKVGGTLPEQTIDWSICADDSPTANGNINAYAYHRTPADVASLVNVLTSADIVVATSPSVYAKTHTLGMW
jgi:hypothetical protein